MCVWSLDLQPYVESLVRQAYATWSSLQELDGTLNETALITQGIN
jgi:hypothetical protein